MFSSFTKIIAAICLFSVLSADLVHVAPRGGPTAHIRAPAADWQGEYGPEFELRGKWHLATYPALLLFMVSLPVFGIFADRSIGDVHFFTALSSMIDYALFLLGLQYQNPFDLAYTRLKMKAMIEVLRKHCSALQCKIETVKSKGMGRVNYEGYRVTFAKGWWFEISGDPLAVEVKAMKSTIAEYKQRKAIMQRMIFDAALEVGLKPDVSHEGFLTGGHVNLDVESVFRKNAVLFRNFIVDFYNHYELSHGILGNDQSNANGLVFDQKAWERFRQVIAKFDRIPNPGINDLYVLAKDIATKAYARKENHYALDVNTVEALSSKARIEVRSPRSQESMEQFILLLEFFEMRIKYLESKSDLRIAPLASEQIVKLTEAQKVSRFSEYLAEMNADAEKFIPLLKRLHRGMMSVCGTLFAN